MNAEDHIISKHDDAPDGVERWFYGGARPAGDDPTRDLADALPQGVVFVLPRATAAAPAAR